MDITFENALRFVSDALTSNPSADKNILIEKAAAKFNLTPLQTEQLEHWYRKRDDKTTG